ncbi:MAG: hypothetical protein KDB52_12510, partial [Solirubrobacterales bacterium]|nr:hypothetical protein [Solirubrobacterales bacterium]
MSSQGAGGPDLNLTRRSLLGRLGLTAAASAGAGALLAGRGAAPAGAMNHEEMVHVHGGADGPVLRDGESFDPARANGFDPDRFLR